MKNLHNINILYQSISLNISLVIITLIKMIRFRNNITTILILVMCILFFTKGLQAQTSNFRISSSKAGNNSNTLSTNSSSDSINISQLVQKQIDAAKMKQRNSLKNTYLPIAKKSKINKSTLFGNTFVNIRKVIPLSDDLLIKLLILGFVAIILTALISTRRLRSKKKTTSNELKKNIKLLREEKIISKKDKKLASIRNKLTSLQSSHELSSIVVSNKAREMNISKGEIYLAAKISHTSLIQQTNQGNRARRNND